MSFSTLKYRGVTKRCFELADQFLTRLPERSSESRLCTHCQQLTIEQLLGLHEEHLEDENYLWEEFPSIAFYSLKPSFPTLVKSAEAGCGLCEAIHHAILMRAGLNDLVLERQRLGLDTTIRIHLALNERESKSSSEQVFDRIFIKVGFDDWESCNDDRDIGQDRSEDEVEEVNREITDYGDHAEMQDEYGSSTSVKAGSRYDELSTNRQPLSMASLLPPNSDTQGLQRSTLDATSADGSDGSENSDGTTSDGHLVERDGDWPGRRVTIISLVRPQNASTKIETARVGEPYGNCGLDSVEIFRLARDWLETCSLKHPNANCPEMQDCPLPIRVIDVASSNSHECPKIIISKGSRGRYLALSHCWGDTMDLKTTTETLTTYQDGIPWQTIPRTFCDAIYITQQLGFRYLWIDALCIVQDSQTDWQQQSAIMHEVYGNASLVIAAAASVDSHAGIFGNSNVQQCRTYCSLKFDRGSTSSDSVQVVSYRGDEDFMDPLFRLPLAKRGWTLQERILSQRVLHYGARRIYWQCRSAHLSADNNPPHDRAGLDTHYGSLLKFPQLTADDPADPRYTSLLINSTWLEVVESYNRYRVLTFATDKLTAIAGIARAFQNWTKDEYIAGIWRNDWARGILWQTWESTVKVPSRAPSWSWVRWDGYVAFEMKGSVPYSGDRYRADLLHHSMQPVGHNPFEGVATGSLRLNAWMTNRVTLGEVNKRCNLCLDDFSVNPHHKDMANIVASVSSMFFAVVLVDLFYDQTSHDEPQDIWKWAMIVLKPVDNGDEKESQSGQLIYERAGVAYHRLDEHGEFSLDGWIRQDVTIV